MLKTKTLKLPTNVYLIALVAALIGLSGCVGGKIELNVSEAFLDALIAEQEMIDELLYPATVSVVDDWIMQNEPLDKPIWR